MRDVASLTSVAPDPPCRSGAYGISQSTSMNTSTGLRLGGFAFAGRSARSHSHFSGQACRAPRIFPRVANESLGVTIGLRSSSMAFIASAQAPDGSRSRENVFAHAEARRADA